MTAAATCPHCFAPVRGDGRPTCLCAAAEAEDFDPLRLRPYVSLPDRDGGPDGAAGGAPPGDTGAGSGLGDWGRPDALEDLPGVDAAVHRAARPAGPASQTFRASGPGPTDPPVTPSPRSAPPGRPPPRAAPRPTGPPGRHRCRGGRRGDRARHRGAPGRRARPGGAPGRRRDRPHHDPPDHRRAHPFRAGPERPAPATSRSRHPGATVAPPRPPTPPPTPPPSPVRASGSVAVPTGDVAPSAPPSGPIVLREGSSGPEVVELQGRLRQVALYTGAADGQYGAAVRDAVARYQRTYGVHGDPDGVYGPATRASLEARTPQP
ncbi:peptidoglycan-binding domain-containing protein [Streptomyces noursei]|uniref:peptidoglycan-binding domain-containing protein n=1 Tax=Streptomyces noursei TaxID=1971 RepID=UPI001F470F4A|nr:peptidoglycan-binding domain-containing protein [Streptomyces noursei]